MTASKLFAAAICAPLVLPASTAASAGATPVVSTDTVPSTASQNPESSLRSKGYNILFLDQKPRQKSLSVLDHDKGAGRGGAGMSEGVPLETLLWGGGGAIIGSFAGPVGAVAGGAVGFLVGLGVGIVMPRKQSSPKFRD